MTIPVRILAIEDEPQMQKFLRASLEAEGYRVIEAEAGKEGIALARTHNPDLFLLDLGLPDIDGMDVTREIRTFSAKPIIVISARGQ
jgi:two-component system KDP operon response regulator KdpE